MSGVVRETPEARFWRKVRKTETCWEWIGGRVPFGYGGFLYDGKVTQAHRAAYRMLVGPIPAGMLVRHTCDNPPCVNPAHLLLGTDADNMADCSRRDRSARRFSNAEAKSMIARHAAGESQRSIARDLRTSQALVWYVVNRRSRYLMETI